MSSEYSKRQFCLIYSVFCYNTGYLFLRGTITESSDMTGATRTNLEFRNSSSDLVAFFDTEHKSDSSFVSVSPTSPNG